MRCRSSPTHSTPQRLTIRELTLTSANRGRVERGQIDYVIWLKKLSRLEEQEERLLDLYLLLPHRSEQLNDLEPEERNRTYKMHDLTVLAHEDGSLELNWALGSDLCRDNEPLPPGNYRTRDR